MKIIVLSIMPIALVWHQALAKNPRIGDVAVKLKLLELEANNVCRGGKEKELAKMACDQRKEIGKRLNDMGWCLGRQRQPDYMMEWHRCESNSMRFEN